MRVKNPKNQSIHLDRVILRASIYGSALFDSSPAILCNFCSSSVYTSACCIVHLVNPNNFECYIVFHEHFPSILIFVYAEPTFLWENMISAMRDENPKNQSILLNRVVLLARSCCSALFDSSPIMQCNFCNSSVYTSACWKSSTINGFIMIRNFVFRPWLVPP